MMDMFGDRAISIFVCVMYVLALCVNALVTSGISVPLTNTDIADSHPVYVLPSGYAFSIWGIIYILVGVFTVVQALNSQLSIPCFQKARPYAIASLIFNMGWLYTFSFELYWVSFTLIVGYALSLWQLLEIFNVNYLLSNEKNTWHVKIASLAFSANAAWVTVATGLQSCINLLDGGWAVTEDFSMGILFVVTALAIFNVFRRADIMFAFVSAWALGGIINNQSQATSDFGTAKAICTKPCMDLQRVCKSGLFKTGCETYTADPTTNANLRLVAQSPAVATFCYTCICFVLVALLVGVIRAVLIRRKGNRDDVSTAVPLDNANESDV